MLKCVLQYNLQGKPVYEVSTLLRVFDLVPIGVFTVTKKFPSVWPQECWIRIILLKSQNQDYPPKKTLNTLRICQIFPLQRHVEKLKK